ncbi:FGFR1 oncoprotein partner 2 [Cichlidogyrus casuarinus]|uniref:FGFR1 oncoprotein partner 2 n=1 Tax=Cichlidogyrus casuarinus TaxID=1844966 RepID=A0ABD2Q0T6_9PLAT
MKRLYSSKDKAIKTFVTKYHNLEKLAMKYRGHQSLLGALFVAEASDSWFKIPKESQSSNALGGISALKQLLLLTFAVQIVQYASQSPKTEQPDIKPLLELDNVALVSQSSAHFMINPEQKCVALNQATERKIDQLISHCEKALKDVKSFLEPESNCVALTQEIDKLNCRNIMDLEPGTWKDKLISLGIALMSLHFYLFRTSDKTEETARKITEITEKLDSVLQILEELSDPELFLAGKLNEYRVLLEEIETRSDNAHMNLDISLQKTLSDANQLTEMLKKNDEEVEVLRNILSQAKSTIDMMRDYQEDDMSFSEIQNAVNRGPYKTPLILCLAAENKQVKLLKLQNKTLNESIEQYDKTMEMIMTKYRIQMTGVMRITQLEQEHEARNSGVEEALQTREACEDETRLLREKYTRLEQMVQELVANADQYSNHLQEDISRLRKENQGLREILTIAKGVDFTIPTDTNTTPTVRHVERWGEPSPPEVQVIPMDDSTEVDRVKTCMDSVSDGDSDCTISPDDTAP